MKNLIIPKKLNAGDKVAFISISGGRAGDKDMVPRYMLGKRRLKFSNREYYNLSGFSFTYCREKRLTKHVARGTSARLNPTVSLRRRREQKKENLGFLYGSS